MKIKFYLLILINLTFCLYSRELNSAEKAFNYHKKLVLHHLNQGVKVWNKWLKARRGSETKIGEVRLENKVLNGIDLSAVRIFESTFVNIKFKKSNFNKTRFFRNKIINTDFSFSHFSYSDMSGIFIKTKFNCVKFYKTEVGSYFLNCIFDFSHLPNCEIGRNFRNCSFKDVKFIDTVIRSGSTFEECIFTNAVFKNIVIIRVHGLPETKFQSCNFTHADFTGAVTLNNALFINCDFNGAKVERKWFNYLKTQKVKNFNKIRWQ